ncbi:hypothetical protein B0T20DRAFT_496532 [Sordaria brevicollis]|uniref:Uncharacterized protein n=1 Tax=Sordaria brevicollis TaxID=83679 RepID=A0AAE0UE76_SORBR|nr:hypothetical protein B0T20DRAFT_496532 [Sordaria brevicollis]
MHLSTLSIVTSIAAAGSASAFHWGTSAPPAGFGAAAAATDAVAPAPAGFAAAAAAASEAPVAGGPPAAGGPGARRPVAVSDEDVASITAEDLEGADSDADVSATAAEEDSDCEEESDDEGEGAAPVVGSTTIDCPFPTNFTWNGAPVVVTASTVLTLPCETEAPGATAAPFRPPPVRPPHGGPWDHKWNHDAPASGSAAPAPNSFSTPCDSFITQTAVATATNTEIVIPVTHAEPTWTKAPVQPTPPVTAGAGVVRGYPAVAAAVAVVFGVVGFFF